jgi:WD40 repeat protein
VILNNHARNNDFICSSISDDKAYIGSNNGMLYIVDIQSKQLENVYKLHDNGICSIKVQNGFCGTGSIDQYLRVWPLDFSEFFLEAKHESFVSNIDIKIDGLKVLCGNNSNGLGIIDLTNQSYRTVLRSHCDKIKEVECYGNMMISLSEDLTIRVWDIEKQEQLYEFNYSNDDICTYV